MDLPQILTEDFLGQAPENFPPSSSSSRHSLSIGSSSSDCSSFLPIQTRSALTTNTLTEIPHRRYGGDFQFPTAINLDMAITRAMLAVISSSSPPSPSSSFISSSILQPTSPRIGAKCGRSPAFKPYKASLAPKFGAKKRSFGQKMIKNSLSILRRMNLMRGDVSQMEESLPSSHQLGHMMSERKRREKLKGSFDELRVLLPPGSKVSTSDSKRRDFRNSNTEI